MKLVVTFASLSQSIKNKEEQEWGDNNDNKLLFLESGELKIVDHGLKGSMREPILAVSVLLV